MYLLSLSLSRKMANKKMCRTDLEELGVFYDKSPLSVSDLLTKLQKQKPRTLLPEIGRWFLSQTKERLNLNLGMDKIPDVHCLQAFRVKEKLEYLEDYERTFQEYRNEMRKSEFLDDPLNNVLFNEWISNVVKFLQLSQEMVRLVNFQPEEVAVDGKKDSSPVFQDLFSRFSEIFFLLPVSGRKTSLKLMDKDVYIPDLRYFEFPYRGPITPLLVMFCEDKKENNEKKEKLKDPVAGGSTDADKHWLSNTLTDEILEQVGRELVAECFKSTFLPNVLGIIFVRTEAIFVYLEIKEEHYLAFVTMQILLEKRLQYITRSLMTF